MALRIVADSLADIPEGLRDAAKADGTTFVVADLAAGWALEDVGGLRGALSTERAMRQKAASVAGQYGWDMDARTGEWTTTGMDPVKVREAVDAVASGSVKSSAEIEKFKAALQEQADAELAKVGRQRDSYRTQLESEILDRAALEALATAEAVSPKALMPILKGMGKVEQTSEGTFGVVYYDEAGKPILSNKAGANGAAASAGEVVESLRGSQDYRGLFKAPAAGGSGGSSQSGGSGRAVGLDTSNLSPAELIELGNQRGM